METASKLKVLKAAAAHDVCTSHAPRSEQRHGMSGLSNLGGIYQASTPHGCTALFKVLLSNRCIHNCAYCANRHDANIERTTLTPEELTKTFMQLYERHLVKGLFLSSAVDDNPERSMDNMIKAVEILRFRFNFRGFVHLKILPGASDATISHACRLADRASINIEAPTSSRLATIAKTKNYEGHILRAIHAIRREEAKGRLPSGQTTQFIVGAAQESDDEILSTSESLYRDALLRRIYFSAFTPLEGTPLENSRRTAPLREHRLYQCDFLMREYGFAKNDLILNAHGDLPLDADPKLLHAEKHPELFPAEVNRAPRELLLKVPGIGPVSADRLIKERQYQRFTELKDLRWLGVVTKRAAPFILLNGKKPEVSMIKKKKARELARQLQFQFSVN